MSHKLVEMVVVELLARRFWLAKKYDVQGAYTATTYFLKEKKVEYKEGDHQYECLDCSAMFPVCSKL